MAKQTFTTGQVLTAAQMTSLQQTAMLGGAASAKTASYTLVAADAGTAISMSNAGATTITVNTSLFAAGDTVQITNLGAGVCTITAGTATIDTSASLALAQYESGTLDFTSTSAAIFIKGAGAAAGGGLTLSSIASGSLSGTSLTLSSLTAYDTLVLRIFGASDNTESQDVLQINGSSSGIYDYITVGGKNSASFSTAMFAAANATGDTSFNCAATDESITSSNNAYFIVLTNCKSAGFTNFDCISRIDYNNAGTNRIGILTGKGIFKSAAAVSSITFFPSSTSTYDAGTYELFGG